MFPLLAEVANDPSIGGAWDVAQKVGAGGALVLIVVCFFMAKALVAKDAQVAAEVSYSKELGKQMLTVTSELSTVIRGMDQRDSKTIDENRISNSQLLQAINELKNAVSDLRGTVLQHMSDPDKRIARAA